MSHTFESQPGAPNECRRCSLSPEYHLPDLTSEPEGMFQGLPANVLPGDDVEWRHVLCPRCGVQSGDCLGDFGYVMPHRERIEAAS